MQWLLPNGRGWAVARRWRRGIPAHVLAACVACSHVHCSPAFWPVSRCRCLVSQQPLFSNRRQGNKSFAHTHNGVLSLPPVDPSPAVAMANKLTTIKRFSAGGSCHEKGEIYEPVRSVYCRPKNYSVHKLLNAKSFDFNYAENFYCQTCGCRTRTFAAFSSFRCSCLWPKILSSRRAN